MAMHRPSSSHQPASLELSNANSIGDESREGSPLNIEFIINCDFCLELIQILRFEEKTREKQGRFVS
jgi:hypothetical protein